MIARRIGIDRVSLSVVEVLLLLTSGPADRYSKSILADVL